MIEYGSCNTPYLPIHLPEKYPRVGITDRNEWDDVPCHGIDERTVHDNLRVLNGKQWAYTEKNGLTSSLSKKWEN